MRNLGVLCIAAAAAIAGCDSPQAVLNKPVILPGTSNVEGSAVLARDVLNAIFMIDKPKDLTCESRALSDTRIIVDVEDGTFSQSGVLLSGKWLEVWSINRCGSLVPYTVEFTADGAGGTYFSIGTQ